MRALAEAVAKQRGYADFFHWHEKRQKELGLLEAFAEAAVQSGLPVSEPRLEEEGQDPPDAWATFEDRRIAIELTEFVDQDLVRAQRQGGRAHWRWWTQPDFEAKLQSVVRNKDHAGFGTTVDYWLVIHCDEPALSAEIVARYLAELTPIATRGVLRSFMLLSYEPAIKRYPLLEVTMERAA
jgi:hypothetical protein